MYAVYKEFKEYESKMGKLVILHMLNSYIFHIYIGKTRN